MIIKLILPKGNSPSMGMSRMLFVFILSSKCVSLAINRVISLDVPKNTSGSSPVAFNVINLGSLKSVNYIIFVSLKLWKKNDIE